MENKMRLQNPSKPNHHIKVTFVIRGNYGDFEANPSIYSSEAISERLSTMFECEDGNWHWNQETLGMDEVWLDDITDLELPGKHWSSDKFPALKEKLSAFKLHEYHCLGVVARLTEIDHQGGEVNYEFADYYPENSEESQRCEWAVVGFVKERPEDDVEQPFEVIALFWEKEAADAFLRMLAELSGLPISAMGSENNI